MGGAASSRQARYKAESAAAKADVGSQAGDVQVNHAKEVQPMAVPQGPQPVAHKQADTHRILSAHTTSKVLSESLRTHAQEAQDEHVRAKLMQALRLRKKYLDRREAAPEALEPPESLGKVMVMVDGLAEVHGLDLPPLPTRHEFKQDLISLWKVVKDPECKSAAMSRLERLSNAFQTYQMDHSEAERGEAATIAGDLYSVMKVDNHIHLAAAMTPRMLLRFIKDKLRDEPTREVVKGKTLRKLLSEAIGVEEELLGLSEGIGSASPSENLKVEHLDTYLHVDALRTVADDHFYHRFDNFNDAYSPLGCAHLRTVFLKSSNHIDGAYFGELAKVIIESYETNDTYAEMRLSIYGRSLKEWDGLASWLKRHSLHRPPASDRNLWMVQIPRVFGAFCKQGFVQNFEELLNNIFQPLFEVALDPATHPDLAEVLPVITGVDSVDDESVPDQLTVRRSQLYGEVMGPVDGSDVLRPELWAIGENPPYSYYSYYIFANICRWNHLCKLLGRPWHFTYRPHAGEAGEVHHLATTFLLADGINHGINLQHSPVLQYLYYVAQIGISVAPLSNNALFLKMSKSPFPDFFQRGLNVTLSTDDPLMFHATKEPLLEEYTTARCIFGLKMTDMCEIAANSVRQSSFSTPGAHPRGRVLGLSRQWSMEPTLSNIPQRRLNFRRGCLADELRYLSLGQPSAKELPEVPAVDWTEVDLGGAPAVAARVSIP